MESPSGSKDKHLHAGHMLLRQIFTRWSYAVQGNIYTLVIRSSGRYLHTGHMLFRQIFTQWSYAVQADIYTLVMETAIRCSGRHHDGPETAIRSSIYIYIFAGLHTRSSTWIWIMKPQSMYRVNT